MTSRKNLTTLEPELAGLIDDSNSTNITLDAGVTFTGESTNIIYFSVIVISIYSDVSSAEKGFCLQFSTDNINWYNAECYTIFADTNKTFTYQPEAKYYRVKYTNGVLNQSEFRLQVTLKRTYIKTSSHAIGDTISNEDDAELVKSTLTAQDVDTQDFVNIGAKNGQVGKALQVTVDQVEETTNSLKTIDYSHAELHSGSHYFSRGYELLSKNGVKDILIVTPNTTKWSHMVIGVEGISSTLVVGLYEDVTTSSDGLRDNEGNRNRNYPNDNTTFIYYNPTITDSGNLLAENIFGAGKNSNGGGSRDTEEIILKQNTKYLLRITEQNLDSTYINWIIDWYEHTNLNI